MNFNIIDTLNNKFRVFRDDLYPFLGGGNKGRKMDYIAKDILAKGANALVTTGGIQSNHNRAVAVFAAKNDMKCTLVLHGSKDSFETQTGNALIMRLSGADIVFVNEPVEIGPAMDKAMEGYKNKGFNPYYIWGGGHTMDGGLAYIDAVDELKQYCDKNNWSPEYIFHASGTGSTQSGIMAGLDKQGMNDTKVIGISVGRKREQAEKVVNEFYNELCEYYNINCTGRETVVLDDYLMGGYGLYNDQLKNLSINSIRDYGFTLDTCYTGKAFYGMLDYINKNKIDKTKVLFWHTGGIFNFLAE